MCVVACVLLFVRVCTGDVVLWGAAKFRRIHIVCVCVCSYHDAVSHAALSLALSAALYWFACCSMNALFLPTLQIGVWSHGPVLGTHIHAMTPSRSAACGITGLDVCVRKPLLITSGQDCSVRIWNYLSKTQELVKTFTEEAHSVAIHPSGSVLGFL